MSSTSAGSLTLDKSALSCLKACKGADTFHRRLTGCDLSIATMTQEGIVYKWLKGLMPASVNISEWGKLPSQCVLPLTVSGDRLYRSLPFGERRKHQVEIRPPDEDLQVRLHTEVHPNPVFGARSQLSGWTFPRWRSLKMLPIMPLNSLLLKQAPSPGKREQQLVPQLTADMFWKQVGKG